MNLHSYQGFYRLRDSKLSALEEGHQSPVDEEGMSKERENTRASSFKNSMPPWLPMGAQAAITWKLWFLFETPDV